MPSPHAFRIDADFHLPPPGVGDLLPYLNDYWRMQVVDRELPSMPFGLTSYPAASPLTANPDFAGLGVREGLDRFGASLAVASVLHGAVALHNPDMRAALLTALNDWMAGEWLANEPRLRGSITISGEDSVASVAEIERLASDQRFVQVVMLAMQELHHGNRHYWPIYEAAERHGLSVAIHAGGLYRNPPSVSGWPSYQFEDYMMQSMVFENILTGLLAEGVFQKFPRLNFVFLESGFAWLPTTLWRNDKTWRGVRQEVPWLDRKPSEIMAGRIFLSLQPVDPPGPDELKRTLKHIGGTDMLLWSTDFPHRQFTGDPTPEGFPEEGLAGLYTGNALRAWPRLASDPAIRAARLAMEETA